MTTRSKLIKDDLIYAAGFMDGEGHIIIYKHNRGGRYKSPTYVLIVGCTNTDKNVIKWFQETFGACRQIRKRHENHPKYKICYSWTIQAKMAYKFLEMILPYLKVKKEQAIVGMKFQQSIIHRQDTKGLMKKVSDKENERREMLYIKLKSLK